MFRSNARAVSHGARASVRAVALGAVVVAGAAAADSRADSGADSGAASPDCRCRSPDGGQRDLGAVECVTIGRSRYLVRCEMSTNTPYWRRLRDRAGCPLALADG